MVMPATGELEQLVPIEEQIVDGEPQLPTRPSSPLVDIREEEKRMVPLPTGPRPPLPSGAQIAEQQAIQAIFGIPLVKWNRYSGSDQTWQELIRWDIPSGYTGDLHELSLQSDNDAMTRWRIVIGNIDQDIPTDRQLTTPVTFPFDRTVLPGGTGVWVEVMSTTPGVPGIINVDATITGSIR